MSATTTQDSAAASGLAAAEIPWTFSTKSCSSSSGSKRLNGRAASDLVMTLSRGNTYSGFVPLTDDYMDISCLGEYAERGYEQVAPNVGPIVMVAALFIPKVGVVVGSKPRESTNPVDGAETVAQWFKRYSLLRLPTYGQLVSGRGGENIDLWHAEDTAILNGGSRYLLKYGRDSHSFLRFPSGSKIVPFGLYGYWDKAPWIKNPCGSTTGTNTAKTDPSCVSILSNLNLQWGNQPPIPWT